MSKQYIIKLFDKELEREIPTEQGKLKTGVRDAEIGILLSLVTIKSTVIKKLSDFNVCADLTRVIEDLGDDEDLIIDDADLKNLKEGFEESAGKRSSGWAYFPELFEQINNPVEKKDEKIEKEEKGKKNESV